jgi:type IV pilus assembly protein PilA
MAEKRRRGKMLGKINKMLKKQQGFTLVELMTVLIILGVVLGIGIPKYLRIQERAEWQADENTIKNIAKSAETYAASINDHSDLHIKTLIDKGLIDGGIVLNRAADGKQNPKTNTLAATVMEGTGETATGKTGFQFTFNEETGNVTNLDDIITSLIGISPGS